MKKLIAILIIITTTPLLQGCAHHGFTERKAPCPPTASLSSNPCNPLPINVASFSTEEIIKEILG